MKHLLLVITSLLLVTGSALAQDRNTAVATANTPVYIAPDTTRTPLRVAAQGTVFTVVAEEGEWTRVQFKDPQFGLRVGYVATNRLRFQRQEFEPVDLSVGDAATAESLSASVQPLRVTRAASFPEYETSVGWAFVNAAVPVLFLDNPTTNVPLGWNVSVAGNLSRWLGVVGDFSGSYKQDLLGVEDADVMIHTMMTGPRFCFRPSTVVTPCGQFLIGLARTDYQNSGFDADHNLAIQPGGLVDIGGPTLAARVEVGWRRVFYEDESSNQFRLVVGAVFRTGARR